MIREGRSSRVSTSVRSRAPASGGIAWRMAQPGVTSGRSFSSASGDVRSRIARETQRTSNPRDRSRFATRPPVNPAPRIRTSLPLTGLQDTRLPETNQQPPVSNFQEVARILSTIGHSTRTIEEFIRILQAHGIAQVIDIRTIPKSRHNPQFNSDQLSASLQAAGIGYRHMSGLGGLRRPRPDSINTGWRNGAFRGFADYMRTGGFQENVSLLMEAALQSPVAILCAEAVPWRCHRSLIADALVVRGMAVQHILDGTRAHAHTLTPFARVEGASIVYAEDGSTPVALAARR